nr:OmpH family outer membrane protein [uncultured Dyadobacter sp.]
MKTRPDISATAPLRWALTLVVTMMVISTICISFLCSSQQKIGFVRSSELVDGYLGMREARNQYQNKSQQWQANVDTLEQDFRKSMHRFQFELAGLSATERRQKEVTLKRMQDNLFQYTSSVRENARMEDEKMTQGVLNQINSFVQEYGKRQGFDIVLGTTLSGSLLYGEKQLDITEEVLRELNKAYRPSGIASRVSEPQKAMQHAE